MFVSGNVIFEQVLNGLTLGGIYALIALGYTMVYGVLRMINFAHSELFMLGAVGGWGLLALWPGGATLGGICVIFFVAMVGSGLLALFLNRVAYAPLRGSPRLTPLLSAIGASLFLQNVVFLWRDSQLAFPPLFVSGHFHVGHLDVSFLQTFIILISIFLMVNLTLFIRKTRLGKAMRAVSQDAETAELMGIPVHRVVALTFFIGGALGGAAGVLNGLYYGSVKYNMGFAPGIKAFTSAVLGGIGSVPGAMLGGFLLGLLESLGAGFLPKPEWKDVFAFVVLIIVLLFRPAGLLGKNRAEKV
ncbi:MAG: branched-chain amino acid ABC transporter permease [Elusimicrobia bacterium]|nr:branched-chain amino acid ABC transporter permease [Elusimicrobiota bacterium]